LFAVQSAKAEQRRLQASQRRQSWIRKRIKCVPTFNLLGPLRFCCNCAAWCCRSSSEGAKLELQPEPVDLQVLNAAIRDIQVSDVIVQCPACVFSLNLGWQARSAGKNLAGLAALREILSRFDAPYEDIIKRHAVTYVCELLQHPDDDIKAEASW
jgi:hypothetical protein